MKHYFSFFISHLSSQKGYSFIELLVVFSIIGILSTIGIASFVNFNNSKSLDGAASDVSNTLTLARQRALSQIKPTSCNANQSLGGYEVRFSTAASTYEIYALCASNRTQISSKKLPPGVTFDPTTPSTILFIVPNATIDRTATARINGFGKNKRVIVDPSGTISVR